MSKTTCIATHAPTTMRVVLVDLHGSLADAARKAGWPGDVIAWTRLQDVALAYEPGSAVVSPANSLGFMDGGVDFPISRVMFPGVEERLRGMIADGPYRTLLGRPCLPIGKALVVPVPGKPGVQVVSAPTMWLPQDVRGTHNAYHATFAAVQAACEAGVSTLIFPGMCTGCGRLKPDEAVAQMTQALQDHFTGKPARWSADDIVREQPNTYMNTEFRPLSPTAPPPHNV